MARQIHFDTTGGPEVLRLREAPVRGPGAGEVVIRVDAIGVNRADVMFREGRYFYPPTLPSGLGYEAAGVVEAIGQGVTEAVVGDLVAVLPAFKLTDHGTYGDHVVVPAGSLVPRTADPVTAAATWMAYVSAYGALVEGDPVAKGDHVLLIAATGGVGLAAIQVANSIGAVPIATTRTPAKKQRLLDAGAAHVVVTGEEDLVGRVREITGGRGVTTAMDPVGGPGLAEAAGTVAPGGRLLAYGLLDPRNDLSRGLPTIPGIDLGLYTLFPVTYDVERRRRAVEFVQAGLDDGAFTPVVDRTFDLTEFAEAHRYLESGAQFGKVVLTVGR
ncbi:zinc-dependent alcohol dehydrogenase family protein [Umezawaea sp. Da 62-37]|uniref:zinc-dependent alcohol dehydrogenase family protein n=1 Tax=Umezawaea sp. Da 62-37 TaxID=3075927 RepID=UPI0028F71A6B|nr:zinc-dependent alcohol dehydrogenase family protein [Umezawaea sp. Da 62-37]WNV91050.1 zinc-dependent alcohol dehydrogenase family protein [Umezawaea sp. Da 62-37]